MPPSLAQLILTAPSSTSALPSIPLSQLDPDALCDKDGLSAALELFQTYVEQHRERLAAAIDRAMEVKGLFEWLVSSTLAVPSMIAQNTNHAPRDVRTIFHHSTIPPAQGVPRKQC